MASMFHAVIGASRVFATLTTRVFLSAGFEPVDVIAVVPVRSTGVNPVAFDLSVVVPVA